jgi:hypothetical protein
VAATGKEVLVSAAAVLTLAVAGCTSGSADHDHVSARFTERTVFRTGPASFTETLRGAFDWSAMKGWAVRRTRVVEAHFVQLGSRCYRRFGDEKWKQSRADDVDGLCNADVFRNPATDDDLVRSVASEWQDLGAASIGGVGTTHYRGRLDLGAVKGPIELWVDRDGVVRRERQRSDERDGFVSVRDYFDFGVDVRVQAPKAAG